MRSLFKTAAIAVFAAVWSVALAASGWAQSRGGRAAGAGRGPAIRVAPRVGTPLNPNFAPMTRGAAVAPGLGFNYGHSLSTRRVYRDRYGRLRSVGFISPLYGSFYDDSPYYPYDAGVNDETEQQPIVQPPAEQNDEQANAADQDAYATAPQSPVPDVGQFILVRRDGQITLAVAFTTSGGRLTYITAEGNRRSFPTAELDVDATKQMNDANGTTLTLPQ